VVINQSLEPLPAGTRIKWQLKDEGKRGFFAIIGELGGGESLVADDVLDGHASKDDACIARVI
jgi:type II secretory pathway predicted ATPase ExeA